MSGSEAIDDPKTKSFRLDQTSRLIIIPREGVNQKSVPKVQDIRKAGSGVYIVEKKKRKLIEFFEGIPHIRFRKAREIPKGDSRRKVPFEERNYSIVVFSFEKPTQQQKKKIQRIIQKTPCIRLRPGVILLPHLRAKERSRYFSTEEGKDLLDSNSFAKEAKNVGAMVRRWTRLKLINKQGEELIQKAYTKMIEHEVQSIERKLKDLEPRVKDPLITTKKIREAYSIQSRKLKQLRHRHRILYSLWAYEEDKEIKRVYNYMLRVRRKIQER